MLGYTSLPQNSRRRTGLRIGVPPSPPAATPRYEIHRRAALTVLTAFLSTSLPFLPQPPSASSSSTSSSPGCSSTNTLEIPTGNGLPLGPRQPGGTSSDAELPAMFAEAIRYASEFRSRLKVANLEPGAAASSRHPADRVALMRAYGRAGKPEESVRLLRQMRESSPHLRRPDQGSAVLFYNTALNTLVENGSGPLDVAAVLDLMESAGVAMSAATHNILLKVSRCSRRFARRVFESMWRSGCRPDEITYSTLILHLSRGGRIDEAYVILQRMLEEGCRPNAYSYTPILRALCIRGRVEEARTLMKVMEESGCPPNTVAHNILIAGLCKERDFSGVEKILRESTIRGWKPNVITYNTYMDGLWKAGRAKEALSQLDIMMGIGLCPSAVTINILLGCLCFNLDLCKAKDLLEKSHQLQWDVSAVNYNTVMGAFCGMEEWAAVVNLLAAMLKKGVAPDTRTYNIVIYSLCRAEKLNKAKRIKNNGVVAANVVTYNILIDGFLGAGATSDAEGLLRSMLEENIKHDLFTYTIRIGYLCKQGRISDACHLFKALKRHLSPDHVVYSALISGLFKYGDFRMGRKLLKEMLEKGLILNVPTFDSVIRACCRRGSCRTGAICFIVDEMFGK